MAISLAGSNVLEETKRLYEVVRVDGPVSDKTKSWLGEKLRNISAYARYAMEEMGLYTRHTGPEHLKADPIEPDNSGVYGGYTNGFRKAINAYTVPFTEYYGKFRHWLKGKRGKLAEYLYDKYGTPERAEDTALYTLAHEELHDLTQIWEMATEDGKVLKPFQERLWNELVGRYKENLPKGMKSLATFFAYLSFTPLLEGANEVATENLMYGKTAAEIRKERLRRPSSYDRYAADAAKVFYDMNLEPGKEAFNLYRYPSKLKDYVEQNPNIIRFPNISCGSMAKAA
jgi:hypothetical protein